MNLVPLSSRELSSYFSRKFIDQWLLEISRLSFHAMYFFLQGNREAISRFFTERSIFPLETQYPNDPSKISSLHHVPLSFIEKIRRTVLNSATCILNSRKLCNEQLLDRRTEISNIYIYIFSPCFHPYLELTEGMGSDFEDFIQARTSKRDRENLITRSLRSRKGWLGSRACRPGARNLARLSAPWMEARHIKMIPVQFSGFHSSRTSRHSINMVFVRLNRAVKSSYYSTNALIKSQRRVGRGGLVNFNWKPVSYGVTFHGLRDKYEFLLCHSWWRLLTDDWLTNGAFARFPKRVVNVRTGVRLYESVDQGVSR